MNKSIKIISILLIITSLFLITSCKSKYTVTFKDYNGTILKEEVLKEGKDATPPVDPTREGYTFIGWDKDYTNIKEDLIITAQYNKIIKEYTVKFKDYDDTLLKEEKVEEGKDATPPADPTREGYTFTGWSEDYTNIQNDLIIIAQYEQIINKYKVTFKTNCETTIEEEYYEKGNKIKEPIPLVKLGYTFIGWYLNEEKWSFIGYVITENITLEAKWEPVKYNLSYELNGGIANNPTTYTIEDNITLNTPTKKGYTFIGWTTEENNIPNLNVNISNETEDKTFTANYQINTYNITYELNGGIANNPTTYTVEDNITLNNPTKEGYTFIGWTTEENNIPNLNVNISNETEDKTFTANYQINTYNITYELNGGLANNPTTYTVEDNITLNNPTKEGYKFFGWTTPENNEPFLNISIKNETENKHFIAIWTNLEFNLKENDQYEVIGMTNSFDKKIVIPEYYNQKKITSIEEGAFSNCDSLTSIEIPNSVTSIGEGAFSYCDSITSIIIPNSVTSIGSYAFRYCDSLTSIIIPNSVTSIGDRAFDYCSSLTSIEIPNSVTSIGDCAFFDCSSLTSVTFEENSQLTSIGEYAFYNCYSLTNIEIPNSVTSIGDSAFEACDNFTSVTFEENSQLTSIGYRAFYYCSSLTNIEIPNSVTSIGDQAFYYCSSLTSIEIPNSVTSIGAYALYFCSSLTSIEIPNSVTSIGAYAFYWCDCLENLYYNGTIEDWCNIIFNSDSSNPMYYAEHFYLKNELNEWEELTELVIPNTITKIGEYQFFIFDNLTSIEIPNSVTSIGAYAFAGCYNLTSIKIPNSVTSIGYEAFSSCDSLTIYCESLSKSSGWDSNWNPDDRPVVWGYTTKE